MKNILLLAIASFLMTSCVSNKKYVYLQDLGSLKMDSSRNITVEPFKYKLQAGDILYISLSTDDERMNKIFTPGSGGPGQMLMSPTFGSTGTMFYFIGFTIDQEGNIELPYLGKVNVSGKSVNEAKIYLEHFLKSYFKSFFLQVKIAEFKFSVIGYVNKPGQYFYQQNKVSILEAIAQAGDLNNLANRYELQLYRQTENGIQIHHLDLTNRNIINSPYWYIQPNDVLYVKPLKVRTVGDMSSLQSSFSLVAPILSTLLLVLNTYILVKNL